MLLCWFWEWYISEHFDKKLSCLLSQLKYLKFTNKYCWHKNISTSNSDIHCHIQKLLFINKLLYLGD